MSFMVNLQDWFFARSRQHVSEDDLLRLMDGELTGAAARRIHRQLRRCWDCRRRYEQIQTTVFHFVDHRNQIAAPFLPPPPGGRDRFIRSLDALVLETKLPWWSQLTRKLRVATGTTMNPILASCVVVILALLVLFLIWQPNVQTVSAERLLDGAESWDHHPSQNGKSGAVYQKVLISTHNASLQRSLYWDSEGLRRRRSASLSPAEREVKAQMERAGVDWLHPLSGSDFRKWRNSLGSWKDMVRGSSAGSLTLVTHPDSTEVKEEALTVRGSDFHPLIRRVVLRDLSVIEISELNYVILAWNEVNPSLFEPYPVISEIHPSASRPGGKHPLPTELDDAELRARLALNEVNADTGEQITIRQSSNSVHVNGIVESQKQKEEIENSLRSIPLVVTSVQTFEDFAQQLDKPGNPVSRVNEYSITFEGSPLQEYLSSRSAPREEVAELSKRLFDASLKIQQESLAVETLDKRFHSVGSAQLDELGNTILNELGSRQLKSLQAAIVEEQTLVSRYVPLEGAPAKDRGQIDATAAELLAAAGENKRLCDELFAPQEVNQRAGAKILSDIIISLNRLQTLTLALTDKYPLAPSNVSDKDRP